MIPPIFTPVYTPYRHVARRLLPYLALSVSLLGLAGCTEAPTTSTPELVVFVHTVKNTKGESEHTLFGHLRPRVESEVGFRTGGKVAVRHVELGQSVKAGQALAQLDRTDYVLAVQSAEAQERAAAVDAAQTRDDAARLQRLLADGSVGAADAERQQARADAAAAQWALAQHQVELARNQASYATLTAPFDGVVTAVLFEAGQNVAAGQPVLRLAQDRELEVQADIPESLATDLGQWNARAHLQRTGNTADIALRLRELAPSAAAQSGTYRARFTPTGPLPAALVRIGMAVDLQLTRPQPQPSAEIPVGALLATGPRPAVWQVAASGVLEATPVQILSQTTGSVRVAGLPDGAQIVSAGAQKLDAGLTVRAIPSKGAER